jgi:hypothetical protein
MEIKIRCLEGVDPIGFTNVKLMNGASLSHED